MMKLTVPIVIRKLEKLYDPPKSFLKWRTPLDLLIVTILSAQCTDARVNMVSPRLLRKYNKPKDYLRVKLSELEKDIHSCGTYKNKAKYIRAVCTILIEQHGSKVPSTMAELITLPGVGRKTAAIVLYAAFGKIEGIPVDTHVLRLSRRLGITQQKTQDKIEKDLMAQTPRKDWGRIGPLLISHARAVCTARNRKCEQCVFEKECPSSKVMGRGDVAAIE